MNNKKARGLNGVVFLVFVVFLFAALWFTNQFDQREKEISWKKFQQLVQNDKIESVEVNQNKSVRCWPAVQCSSRMPSRIT